MKKTRLTPRRRPRLGWLLALTLVTARGQQPDEQRFRVDVNLVTLRFTVKDSTGAFANRLTADQFTVLENGSERPVAFFQAPRREAPVQEPLWLAFLLDVSGSTFGTRAEEILAAQSFFENIHSFTRVGIFGFTDKLMVFHDFSSDRRAALDAFSSARPHLGRTAIYASVNTLIARMAQRTGPGDRKVLIVVSDGLDDDYAQAVASSALARQHDTTIYTIWVPSAAQLYIGPAHSGEDSGTGQDRAEKERAFASLSERTGGRHFGGFETILDFDNVLAEINDELFGNLYTLGYYTEHPELERAQRNIEVRVARPDVSVHGIFERLPDRDAGKKRYIAALFDNSALEGLTEERSLFHEIGADMDILRPRDLGGRTSLPFRLKISPYALQRDAKGGIRTQFGVIGVLSDLNGNEVVRLREVFRAQLGLGELRDGRGIIYTNRLLAPPGKYMFRLALIEIPSWRMVVLERPVQIREAADGSGSR